jgi:H+/Cl- antiporter ClcA
MAVGWNQIVFGSVLVAALVFLAVFYAWRQVRVLRGQDTDLISDEAQYQRRRAWRRLVNSALMLILAGLLAGLLIGLENPTQRLAEKRAAERAALPEDQEVPFTPEERRLVNAYYAVVVALLLVLLAVVVVAGMDAWSTRAFALRQYRKLQADRRAMIERQTVRLRQERNGD